jgi:hypothetical protein
VPSLADRRDGGTRIVGCDSTADHEGHEHTVPDRPGVALWCRGTLAGYMAAPRPVESPADRLADARTATQSDEAAYQALTGDLRQTRQHLADARQTIAAQAAQLRANGTLLCRLRELDEQRDRAWAAHDTVNPTCQDTTHDHSTSSCLGPGYREEWKPA